MNSSILRFAALPHTLQDWQLQPTSTVKSSFQVWECYDFLNFKCQNRWPAGPTHSGKVSLVFCTRDRLAEAEAPPVTIIRLHDVRTKAKTTREVRIGGASEINGPGIHLHSTPLRSDNDWLVIVGDQVTSDVYVCVPVCECVFVSVLRCIVILEWNFTSGEHTQTKTCKGMLWGWHQPCDERRGKPSRVYGTDLKVYCMLTY